MTTTKPLTDQQLIDFIINGYVIIKTDLPAAVHADIYRQAEEIFASEGNPGNAIYPKIPQLADVLNDPAVAGALTSILGPDYLLHPHRHCHQTPPGQTAQGQHQDSYEDDENVRHHRTRWAMAFYYPQDVTLDMGPSAIQPASQYYNTRSQAKTVPEIPLCGQAGTVIIIHYDLWHRALTNSSNKNRFMMKFLFCRTQEPNLDLPAHNFASEAAPSGAKHPQLWESVWKWYRGMDVAVSGATFVEQNEKGMLDALRAEEESARLNAAYALAAYGEEAIPALVNALCTEAQSLADRNLKANHTNPSQLNAGFALSAIGQPAVPALIDLLQDSEWPVRAAAANILGDIGTAARAAESTLCNAVTDDSEWVRRNAVEALGVISNGESCTVDTLAGALSTDDADFVRHNAALALAKLGPAAASTKATLQKAASDENLYVRENAKLALGRMQQQ